MSPTQFYPLEQVANTKVIIRVSAEQIHSLVSILMAHQVQFEVNFGVEEKRTPPPNTFRSIPTLDEVLNKIFEKYIQTGLECPIPTETDIAQEFGLSFGKFRQSFKRKFGDTFHRVYMTHRMEKAKELLRQGLSCREVARQVGYGPHSDIKFNKMFQKYVGMTPKKYQLFEAFK